MKHRWDISSRLGRCLLGTESGAGASKWSLLPKTGHKVLKSQMAENDIDETVEKLIKLLWEAGECLRQMRFRASKVEEAILSIDDIS
ncbi:uncharacterized [Tachysurus ichikawai]